MHISDLIKQILEAEEITADLTDDKLSELYNTVKGTDVEEEVWRRVVLFYRKPLTNQLALDLIDRKIALMELGHSRQHDEVMWRLAELVEEALLTLAKDIYTKSTYGGDETEALLNKFHYSRWMLESLIYIDQPSSEKRALLESAIRKNDESEYLQSLLAKVDQIRFASRPDLSTEAYHTLFETEDPRIWLSLSKNPNTPVEILSKLIVVKDIQNARQIRNFARLNLHVK